MLTVSCLGLTLNVIKPATLTTTKGKLPVAFVSISRFLIQLPFNVFLQWIHGGVEPFAPSLTFLYCA